MDVRIGPRRVWSPKNWCFVTAVLEKTLESSLDSKIKPVNPKGNQPWVLTRRTDAEAETPILWPPDVIHSISLDHFTPHFMPHFHQRYFPKSQSAWLCVCCYCWSCVWLFETPWMVARQASLSMGFPRKEYWSGLPFPSLWFWYLS